MEYPIQIMADRMHDVTNSLPDGTLMRGTFARNVAGSIISETAETVQNLSSVMNVGDSSLILLGPPLTFSVNRRKVACPTHSQSFLSDMQRLSDLVNASWLFNISATGLSGFCFSSEYESCSDADCGILHDVRHGDLPIRTMSSVISESTVNVGQIALFYSPWFDTYTILRFYMDLDINQFGRVDSYITTFTNILTNDSLQWGILSACILSAMQLTLDCMYFYKPNWFETDPYFVGPWILYKVPPILVSSASLLFFTFKYLTVSATFSFVPQQDWRALETKIMYLNSVESVNSTQLALDAYSDLAFQETLGITMRTINILLLFVFLFRFVLYLGLHPRLAMVTETLRHGWDDFVHFAVVFSAFLLGFAYVFCMSFGNNFYYASSFPRSVFIQFVFLMSTWDIPDTNTANQWVLVAIFYTLFGLIMYFTGLYFVLAFIQDAYQKYLQDLRKVSDIVRSPFQDVKSVITWRFSRIFKCWPSRASLLQSRHLNTSRPFNDFLRRYQRDTQQPDVHENSDGPTKLEYLEYKNRIIHKRKLDCEMKRCNRLLVGAIRTLRPRTKSPPRRK